MSLRDEALKFAESIGREVEGESVDPNEKIRFSCLRICGAACCTFNRVIFLPYDIVRMAREDVGSLAGLMVSLGERKLIATTGRKSFIPIVVKPEGVACPFLEYEKGIATCTIYKVRPNECRVYPFNRIFVISEDRVEYFAIKDTKICPPKAFLTGDEITIFEYWKNQGVLDVGEREVKFIEGLSRVVRDWVGDREKTPIMDFYIVLEFLTAILILGIIDALDYEHIVSALKARLDFYGKSMEKIVAYFIEDPTRAINELMDEIERMVKRESSE